MTAAMSHDNVFPFAMLSNAAAPSNTSDSGAVSVAAAAVLPSLSPPTGTLQLALFSLVMAAAILLPTLSEDMLRLLLPLLLSSSEGSCGVWYGFSQLAFLSAAAADGGGGGDIVVWLLLARLFRVLLPWLVMQPAACCCCCQFSDGSLKRGSSRCCCWLRKTDGSFNRYCCCCCCCP
jgi:hypothetical protein